MRFASTAAVFACLTLGAAAGSAQGDPSKTEAMKRYQEGIVLYDHGQHEAAYARFAEAYAVVQTPSILFNLARTEQLTGRNLDAARHFKDYLALPAQPKITADLRKQATTFLAQLASLLGHIEVEAPQGTLLSVDDKVIVAAGTIDVVPGSHSIVGKLGPVSRTATVACDAGQTVPVKLAFDAPEAAAPIAPPTAPAAQANAGTPLGPTAGTPAPTSEHVSAAGSAVRWGLTGAAAVALGLGIGFDVDSHSKAGDASTYLAGHPGACANSASASCTAFNQILGDENASKNVSYAFFGVAAVSAVGAAAAWIFWPKDRRVEQGWVMPAAGPHGAGLYAGGSF